MLNTQYKEMGITYSKILNIRLKAFLFVFGTLF